MTLTDHAVRRGGLILLLLLAPMAYAGPELLRSNPAAGSNLDESPRAVRLWFSETPEVHSARLGVEGPEHPVRIDGLHTMGGNDLMARISGHLPPGDYTLTWQVSGTSGDIAAGEVPFTVRAAVDDHPTLTVGIVLYPNFEVLDVYGPVEMWGYVPEFHLITIAEHSGPVMSTQGMATLAEYGFDDAPPVDVLMVPGGIGSRTELDNPELLAFLRSRHAEARITTSVCTGSALLAAAGVLDGHSATSNKRAFSLAVAQSDKVDWIERARWVDDGRVVTSSGVSAGMDMALGLVARLFGADRARQIASGVEYRWNEDPTDDPFVRFIDLAPGR